jgi:hypothetical protein
VGGVNTMVRAQRALGHRRMCVCVCVCVCVDASKFVRLVGQRFANVCKCTCI